jgi:L-fucose isomerase-like protein
VVAVLTGGTEGKFVQLVKEGQIDLQKPVYLMVSGQSNSLAASLEILSYIRQHNGTGKVLDKGQSDEAESTKESVTRVPSKAVLHSDTMLRLGVVGFPSDWLIASHVDYRQVLEKMNCEVVDIPIEEVTSLGEADPGMQGAEAIYRRLKELVEKYNLQGVTLRCFDLLTTVKNTGCIALSKLNDEGIPAACEGDIPTLLTMMVCKRLTGELCFQVNPARIQADGEMLFAHCTIPLDMVEDYEFDTHFESGIGVGIRGYMKESPVTIFKLAGDLSRYFVAEGTLVRNQAKPDLCRTQQVIQLSDKSQTAYFLTNPIGNHHIIMPGSHRILIDALLKSINFAK